MEGLAKDGHEVTVVSPYETKNPHKNYKQVFLELSEDLFRKGMNRLVPLQ